MKNENKINLIIVIVAIILIAGAAFLFMSKNLKTDSVKTINISEFKEKINNHENFVLVVTQEGCTHCKSYLPTLRNIANKYKLTFFEMDEKKWSDEDTNYFKSLANFDGGTPTTFFFENGEEKATTNRLVGNVPEYRVIEKLKALGYINE